MGAPGQLGGGKEEKMIRFGHSVHARKTFLLFSPWILVGLASQSINKTLYMFLFRQLLRTVGVFKFCHNRGGPWYSLVIYCNQGNNRKCQVRRATGYRIALPSQPRKIVLVICVVGGDGLVGLLTGVWGTTGKW